MYGILLVDDDRVVRYHLKKNNLWEKYGFSIYDEAADGYEALEKVFSSHIDMAFVDIKMPRIDGIEFLKELREKQKSLCVVLMSGYSDFSYVRQGIVLEAFDYILKPVDEASLSDVLSRAKLYLDAKRKEEVLHSKLCRLLDESMNIFGFNREIADLFRLITGSPGDATQFADQMVKRIIAFYKNDTDKIEIILKQAKENLRIMLFEAAPWLAFFDVNLETEIINSSCDIPVGSSFTAFIRYVTSVVKSMHLDHENSVVRRLCEYVLSHSDEKISLKSAAAELGFSSGYLCRLFKQKTGESYTEYVTKVKMQRAKALLRTGKYKNYEISDILGYRKTDYFCSLFKIYTGITPMDYRQSTYSQRKCE